MIEKWDEQPYLQDPNVMGDEDFNDWNWEHELSRNDLPWRRQLIAVAAVQDGSYKPIGVVQIIDPLQEESHYWGSSTEDLPLEDTRALDIWIGEPEYLGRGYGTQTMKQALEGSFVFGDTTVQAAIVDPMVGNPSAHKFYQSVGFQPLGKRSFGPDECLVHRVTRQQYYAKHPKNPQKHNE
ncbi:AAC/APH [Seminavis robusta]|uniref:AAC/APH n=1 Tax=Seminavis robusta TaxID=568900 RepID=A0A9N8HRU3_9STRA|nr:AAC/APH [Seminavis robusta]|eukprot:Sro1104_g241830.1 AAC/APH (181) ;mRNA; r:23529-24071